MALLGRVHFLDDAQEPLKVARGVLNHELVGASKRNDIAVLTQQLFQFGCHILGYCAAQADHHRNNFRTPPPVEIFRSHAWNQGRVDLLVRGNQNETCFTTDQQEALLVRVRVERFIDDVDHFRNGVFPVYRTFEGKRALRNITRPVFQASLVNQPLKHCAPALAFHIEGNSLFSRLNSKRRLASNWSSLNNDWRCNRRLSPSWLLPEHAANQSKPPQRFTHGWLVSAVSLIIE